MCRDPAHDLPELSLTVAFPERRTPLPVMTDGDSPVRRSQVSARVPCLSRCARAADVAPATQCQWKNSSRVSQPMENETCPPTLSLPTGAP